MIKHWTKEEESLLLKLKAEGKKLADIALVLDRTLEAIRTRSKRLSKHDKDLSWSVEEVELLRKDLDYSELMILLPERTKRAIMSKCEKLGIKKRFLGGSRISRGTQVSGGESLLYLVDFGNFKKVGVTQVGIQERFKQEGQYKILDSVKMCLEDALETEAEILKNMRPFRVVGNLRRGSSECFNYDCTLLEDII